jgi:hypothetical protein
MRKLIGDWGRAMKLHLTEQEVEELAWYLVMVRMRRILAVKD